MKLQGRCVVGDVVRISSFTSGWPAIKFYPGTFYRKYSRISECLSDVKGLYAEIDMGQFVLIRFSDKEDIEKFSRMYSEYA